MNRNPRIACLYFVTAAVVTALALPSSSQSQSAAPAPPPPRREAPLAPVDGFPANPADEIVARPGANPLLPGIPLDAASLIDEGQFDAAARLLEKLLQSPESTTKPLDPKIVDRQIEKLRRYRKDYTVSSSDLVQALNKRMRDFKEAELEVWISQGLVDRMAIDGKVFFADPTVSNLFYLSPELRKRQITDSEGELNRFTRDLVKALKKEAADTGKSMLAPRRFHAEMTLRAKAVPDRDGQTLRCWMPFPREYPFISDIKILKTEPSPKLIAPPDAPQRTVYFERVARADSPTTFSLVYEFTALARVNGIDDEKVQPVKADDPIAREFTREEAHVKFTPELRALHTQIAGNERNPARLARAFYLWVSNNIRYSYAREYSTLDNLSQYCAARRAGDCGQEALVFIALCRMAGIPARWQSAWTCYPLWRGMHDWTEIYLPPYGWVPVDPYMGIWATRYMETLTPAERIEIRDFYFGSMDSYRLPANAAHSAPFTPAKKGWRSDDVDNQRGELEWADGTNLYFGDFKSSMKITDVTEKTQ